MGTAGQDLCRLAMVHLPVVALLIGADDRLVEHSGAAKSLLPVRPGARWQEVLPDGLFAAGQLHTHVARARRLGRRITLPRVDLQDRSLRVHIVPVPPMDGSFLLQLEELTDALEMEARTRRHASLLRLGRLSADVAHQLRNPLAGISGALQVVRANLDPADPNAPVLGRVVAEVSRMDSLLTELITEAQREAEALERDSD